MKKRTVGILNAIQDKTAVYNQAPPSMNGLTKTINDMLDSLKMSKSDNNFIRTADGWMDMNNPEHRELTRKRFGFNSSPIKPPKNI